MRRLLLLLLVLVILAVGGLLGCQAWIALANKGRVFDNADTIPPRDVGLVLGTSKRMRGGADNPYFEARMDAAAKLFRLGKVKRLLLSGDHRVRSYNEPADMKRALLERHVPATAILLDSAGVRTLDSVVRANRVFKFNHFTIISQRDHDERALLIAGHYHIDAIAYAAEDVPFKDAVRSHIHEWLAQVKAILDVYVLQTGPRPPPPAQKPGAPQPSPSPASSKTSSELSTELHKLTQMLKQHL